MKIMKKVKAAAVLLVACAMLSACSATDDQGTSGAVKVMVWDRGSAYPGTTVTSNATVDFIKEAVEKDEGVNLEYVSVPRSGSDEKLNIMVAGGTAPDVIISYTRTMLVAYAQRGGITDLTQALDENGKNLLALHSDMLPYGIIDGKQYAIPARRSAQIASHISFIRKDWLDALGLPPPATKEELYTALRLFKEKDPGKRGSALVPWAMGGTYNSEKYYISFVASFGVTDEETLYVYPQYLKALKPGAQEGYRIMNTLYNEGIISKDFAVDTNDDKYKRDIMNGNAGFFVEDSMRPYNEEWFATLKANVPEAEFIPINVFEEPDGVYRNASDPIVGVYIMVPKTASGKAADVIKYLDWLVQPENTLKVLYTEDYQLDEYGIPSQAAKEILEKSGYSSAPGDLSIVGADLDFNRDKNATVQLWKSFNPTGKDYFSTEYLSALYDTVHYNLYLDKIADTSTPARQQYEASLNKAMLELAYKVISAPAGDFDKTWDSEYQKVIQAGLEKVLEENRAYYQSEVK